LAIPNTVKFSEDVVAHIESRKVRQIYNKRGFGRFKVISLSEPCSTVPRLHGVLSVEVPNSTLLTALGSDLDLHVSALKRVRYEEATLE
jgi:hypothetical protein